MLGAPHREPLVVAAEAGIIANAQEILALAKCELKRRAVIWWVESCQNCGLSARLSQAEVDVDEHVDGQACTFCGVGRCTLEREQQQEKR
jgi:hypothetical protein